MSASITVPELPWHKPCPSCEGSGYKKKGGRCGKCGGRGTVPKK